MMLMHWVFIGKNLPGKCMHFNCNVLSSSTSVLCPNFNILQTNFFFSGCWLILVFPISTKIWQEVQDLSMCILTDWLMIAYLALFSTLLSRLTALACDSTWVTSFSQHIFIFIFTRVVYLSTGMVSATWNCCRLGTSSMYTIQPCSISLHAEPHT